ncbi:secreted phosphoprotein 24 [Ornithorhynchus anatinus]|uniref:Secreted phosphoprotein 24 n=1 Tax=Ornithorhynchus anatinus TaxID=9258 RepID=A0A6I8NPJ9_ORNAN|nr:secreted phosphoprotein 24 [Ornithorhynchus anatinus]
MKVFAIFVLSVNIWSGSGFPVYDYDPGIKEKALSASLAEVNSRSIGLSLFRAFGSLVKAINFLDENDYNMDIDFRVRETECRKDSGKNPTMCSFKKGRHVQTAHCRSSVQISGEEVQMVWVDCRRDFSSSESQSSEEIIFREILQANRRRNSYMAGMRDPYRNRRIWNRPNQHNGYWFE